MGAVWLGLLRVLPWAMEASHIFSKSDFQASGSTETEQEPPQAAWFPCAPLGWSCNSSPSCWPWPCTAIFFTETCSSIPWPLSVTCAWLPSARGYACTLAPEYQHWRIPLLGSLASALVFTAEFGPLPLGPLQESLLRSAPS